jgi:hypothetical protein
LPVSRPGFLFLRKRASKSRKMCVTSYTNDSNWWMTPGAFELPSTGKVT